MCCAPKNSEGFEIWLVSVVCLARCCGIRVVAVRKGTLGESIFQPDSMLNSVVPHRMV